MQAVPLLTLDEVAVLPAGHALAAQAVLQVQDFANQPFVSLSADDPYRRQIDARFAEAGVARQLHLQTHSAVAVCAMVQQGLGWPSSTRSRRWPWRGQGLVVRRLGFSVPFSINAFAAAVPPSLARSAAAAAVPRGPSPGSDRCTAALAEPACELTRRIFKKCF